MRELFYHHKCPLCGGTNMIQIFTLTNQKNDAIDSDLNMVRCKSCSQVFLNPWVMGSEFEDSISVTAKVLDTAIKEGLITETLEPVRGKLKSAYPEMLYLAEKYFDKKQNVLDLGCGSGFSTLALKQSGFDVQAIEANEELVKSAEKLGLEVTNSYFSDYSGEKYAQVTLNSVIEHVHNPIQLLFDIKHKILKKDGYLIVTCPNIESSQTISIGAEFGMFCWGHVWYFSEKTLEKLMEKAGFILVEYYRPNFNLEGIDGNVKAYFQLLKDWDINIYGGIGGIFKSI